MVKHNLSPSEQLKLATPSVAKRFYLMHTGSQRTGKAYGLLAEQPPSLAGLSQEERAKVVVSAVIDNSGNTLVISRVGDLEWELWPFVRTANIRNSEKKLNWLDIPDDYREAVQNVLYAYWKRGRPGLKTPEVSSLLKLIKQLKHLCRYASAFKLKSLADLQALHIANFVHEQKLSGKSPGTLMNLFSSIELLYLFRAEHEGTLSLHPWPDSSAADMAGNTSMQRANSRKVSQTPLIPMDVASTLFLFAEGTLDKAESLMDERDRGERKTFYDPQITIIRDACFYLLGVLTGMRCSELASIEVGAGRTEERNGIPFHWLTGTEYKTKKGLVDYLMPSMGHRILHILERWSEPYRQLLAKQIVEMELRPGSHTAEELHWLATARSNCRRLFLGKAPHSGITTLSDSCWGFNLSRLARKAGTTWALAPHQMRRLYGHTFVRHKLGDLLFLKEQFKHSSINMAQLYAASPRQDSALYDDILSELMRYKGEIIASWLEKDEPLAGGAGHKIMEMRAHKFPDRKTLVMEASKRVLIRSTGHSWCLAQDEGCGGSGIYERGRCGSCRDGVIDNRFINIWEEAYRHHKELLVEAEQWGAGALKRVSADLEQASKILRDLGINPEAENAHQDRKT
ncbi:tyrosine-type recombinase/integrase [Comamonas testosteroni]|uniref:Tyr recombinase domain-containing protein n=1 Tax=Comamonas testosteroni TaxID=285 RepID=A0A096FJQ3_COMTE|nr:tyrosine-type recombinase/integrase [Comamonas testosteroni]KGH30576.1 hypothetical protein P353_10485 [Comamonas testosteroni]